MNILVDVFKDCCYKIRSVFSVGRLWFLYCFFFRVNDIFKKKLLIAANVVMKGFQKAASTVAARRPLVL
jgi:hypothetical protein